MADNTQEELKSVEERDLEWLANVYRGDKEPDLTVRAVLAGMIFGGLMSLSNLYVGLKTGWGLGVDIAAVVVIFAVFKALRGTGIVRREFGLMENTMTMTVAVAASWISSAGLVSAVPALTMLTGYQFVWWQLTLFIAVILYLGLFMAIPLKRQMIQVDSLRFPANIPTGETLLVMYSHGGQAMKKALALGITGLLGAIVAGLRDGLGLIPSQIKLPWFLHRIGLGKLTLSLEPSLIFIGIGALFGIKVGLSMLLGLVLNYAVLAPRLIEEKIIVHPAPKITAVAMPQMPLAIKAGQTFTVRLEEAVEQPELPTAEELKADPELSSAVRTSVLRYTWAKPTTYRALAELERDLNSAELDDGSPNPLHGVLAASIVPDKDMHSELLCLTAAAATTWEAKLSLPADQPADILTELGMKLGPRAEPKVVALTASRAELRTRDMSPQVGGFRNISAWSLWPGATVLVVGGLLALAFQWRTLGRTFASIFTSFGGKGDAEASEMDKIEIPMSWFVVGFLVTGAIAVVLMVWLFSIVWWMGVIAVVLTFFLSAVAARAGAEVGMNPIGALGKVTQLTYGAIAPGNVSANLMTAGLTAGAACSCSDTVGNLKVGHMVGANPRRQFIAQMFGVLAGALLAVPAYFILVPDPNILGGDKYPAPSALIWMGVAKVLSQGLHTLPPSAIMAVGVAFLAGTIIVLVDQFFPKLKPYTPSPAALGIAMTIPAYTSFAMFLGSLIAWILEKKAPKWNDMYTIAIASGGIAGESIAGVVLAAIDAFGRM
jgi:uncharacterized oligopeptide transporter (OPT) family protein